MASDLRCTGLLRSQQRSWIALSPVASSADDKCTPSRFGAQDQIGAAQQRHPRQDPSLRASFVTRGKGPTGSGSRPTRNTPAYPPRTLGDHDRPAQPDHGHDDRAQQGEPTNDDNHQRLGRESARRSTGLGHLGIDNVYYNCNKAPRLREGRRADQARDRETCRRIATPPSSVLDMVGPARQRFRSRRAPRSTGPEIERADEGGGPIKAIEKGDVVLFPHRLAQG